MTVLARGEQSADRVAASGGTRKAAGHSRKSTAFASLDTPAQAYSAVGSEAAAAPPQVAISQAIAPDGSAAPAAETQPDEVAVKTRRKPAKRRAVAAKAKPLGTVAELKP